MDIELQASRETTMLLDKKDNKGGSDGGGGAGDAGKTNTKWRQYLKHNLLLVLLAVAMFVGLAMGLLVRHVSPDLGIDKRRVMYLEFPGTLLMRMLKLLIMPIIVTSLISGVANLPTEHAGRLGAISFTFYISTMFVAAVTGIVLVSLIQPGHVGHEIENRQPGHGRHIEGVDAFMDLLRNIFPSNLIVATFHQTHTMYNMTTHQVFNETTNTTEFITTVEDFYQDVGGETNVLGLVAFSLAFGISINFVGANAVILRNFFTSLHETVLKLVTAIIWYSPIGIAFLLAGRIVEMEDPLRALHQLAFYILTVLVGLMLHMLVTLMLVYLLVARRNPCVLLVNMLEALLTAVGTSSSSATLPVTLRCLEEKCQFSPLVTRFVAPVGAVVNMDGTALYEAVAAIFIAQYNNIPLNLGQLITVGITSVAAALGAASVPEAGLVTLVIVLTSVGLPTEDIALLLAVDWILDRCRTAVNVWGDGIGTGIAQTLCIDNLPDDPLKAGTHPSTEHVKSGHGLGGSGREGGGGDRKDTISSETTPIVPKTKK